MSFKRYRQFIAVAEELHFGRAAERLNIAQPQLSQSLKMLERDLGVTLVERTHNRVALTPAGHAFLEEARRCVLYGERAERVARTVAGGEVARLRIGFNALILSVLPGAYVRSGTSVRTPKSRSKRRARWRSCENCAMVISISA